ncbi:MAG TPA: M23 family metallopeptidase [Bacilli bacterium]|nr:M23 family metallopeptidase [Bacilli bacterium]
MTLINKLFMTGLVVTLALATLVTVQPVQAAADQKEVQHKTLGYATEEEAPPVPVVRAFPYPVSDYILKVDSKYAILSLETEDDVELTISYGKNNQKKDKKKNVKTIVTKHQKKFQDIKIPLVDNDQYIGLKLSNDAYDFTTTILVQDGKILNGLSLYSDYFKVDKFQGPSAVYNSYNNKNTEQEPNNTFSNADATMTGYDNVGSVASTDTVDYWIFDLKSRAFLNFYLGNIPSGSDFDLSVMNASGTEVVGGYNGGNADELKLNVDLQPGIYYIAVKHWAGSGSYLMRYRVSKQWPVVGSTKRSRGFDPYNDHYGLDITADPTETLMYESSDYYTDGCYLNKCYKGNQIVAFADGTVSVVDWNIGGYKYAVYINHTIDGQLIQSRYGHLYSIDPSLYVGKTIKAGDPIGYMGNRGDVFDGTGTHLHFATQNNTSLGSHTNATYDSLMVDPLATFFPGY